MGEANSTPATAKTAISGIKNFFIFILHIPGTPRSPFPVTTVASVCEFIMKT
jgi:hypothetical protein